MILTHNVEDGAVKLEEEDVEEEDGSEETDAGEAGIVNGGDGVERSCKKTVDGGKEDGSEREQWHYGGTERGWEETADYTEHYSIGNQHKGGCR